MGRHLTFQEFEKTTDNAVKYVDETTRRIRLDDETDSFFDAPVSSRPPRFRQPA